jgi:nucleotide-binding universal stress UspA family protein
MEAPMYRTVMLPTDGSDLSRHAIPLALAVAKPANAVVHIVGVAEPAFAPPIYGVPVDSVSMAGSAPANPPPLEQTRTNRHDVQIAGLKTFAQQLSHATGVRFEGWIEEGEVAAALNRHATAHSVDLIVIGTHGRGGIGRAILGSVADELVRTSSRPVLLVPPHGDNRDDTTAADVRHILVSLDGTPGGDAIARHATALAIVLKARCTLLHVTPIDRSGGSDNIDLQRARLDRAAEAFRKRGVETSTALLHGDRPAHWIAEYASTHAIDLVAMSTHGRGGLERLVLGSVTTELVTRKQLPMLLARETM